LTVRALEAESAAELALELGWAVSSTVWVSALAGVASTLPALSVASV
jgi:hypothetical protein